MAKFTLTVVTPRGSVQTVGGGKTLADAKKNAKRALARHPGVEEITVTTVDADGNVVVVERVPRREVVDALTSAAGGIR